MRWSRPYQATFVAWLPPDYRFDYILDLFYDLLLAPFYSKLYNLGRFLITLVLPLILRARDRI